MGAAPVNSIVIFVNGKRTRIFPVATSNKEKS